MGSVCRVRQLIRELNYEEMVAYRLIPDVVALVEEEAPSDLLGKTVRFPRFVYTDAHKDFCHFGILMELVCRSYLLGGTSTSTCVKVALKTAGLGSKGMTKAHWDNYASRGGLGKLLSELKLEWDKLVPLHDPKREGPEYEEVLAFRGKVEGHPDITTALGVFDVKTTTGLKGMLPEASLQILSYFALGKATGKPWRYAGLVLPLQRQVLCFDLTKWNRWSDFVGMLVNRQRIQRGGTCFDLVSLGFQLSPQAAQLLIGSHQGLTGVKGGFVEALRSFGSQKPGHPCQLFMQSPMNGHTSERYITTKELEEAASMVTIYQLRYFTHSPYVINMCYPEKWHVTTLGRELEQTARIGGKGCVVHVGKRKDIPSMCRALANMEGVIRQVAPYATPDCRLLVETPVKAGSEVLTTVEELGDFFGRFEPEVLSSIGVCVDTAHVHGAGYNPLDYLQRLERKYPQVYIGLIHYNGSREERGSRKDGHWPAGSSGDYIGAETMTAVAMWAAARGIPMVTE